MSVPEVGGEREGPRSEQGISVPVIWTPGRKWRDQRETSREREGEGKSSDYRWRYG